jgi:hypothetical protein
LIQSVLPQLTFSFYRHQPIRADFSGGQITSDAGLLPLRAFDQRHHLTSAWAARLSDPRWPLEELLPRADLRNRALMEAGRTSRKSCSSAITEGLRFLPRSYAHEATLFKTIRRRLIQVLGNNGVLLLV